MSSNCKAIDSCTYQVRAITIEDKPEVFQFIKRFFYTGEPLNEALNSLGRGLGHDLTLDDCPMTSIEEGHSLMAVTNSGEIIAVIQNGEEKPEEDNSDSDSNLDKGQIVKLLNYVEMQINELARLENANEREMLVRTVTVHDAWKNKGLGRKLLEQTRDLARKKGFQQMRAICTSAYSAKMFARCGFECVYAVKYEDWKNEGNINFLPRQPHSHVKGMVLRL